MKNNYIRLFLVALSVMFSLAGAVEAPSQILATAGELVAISQQNIELKVAVGQKKLPAYGEEIPEDMTIYEEKSFAIDSATKCFDADESTASKLNGKDNFLVYQKIAAVPCGTLADRKNITVYHVENEANALAIRDNGFPHVPIFGAGSSASPITNGAGAAFVMQMLGTSKPNSADPVLQQVQTLP